LRATPFNFVEGFAVQCLRRFKGLRPFLSLNGCAVSMPTAFEGFYGCAVSVAKAVSMGCARLRISWFEK